MPKADLCTAAPAALMTLFLACPLIGIDWCARFHLLAIVPAAVTLSFFLVHATQWWSGVVVRGTLLVTVVLAIVSISPAVQPSIPVASYGELRSVQKFIPRPEHTLVVARHGLEWWAAWALRTKVAHDFALEPEDWTKYEQVLFLRSQPLPGRKFPGIRAFPEVRIPPGSEILFRGDYFVLARCASAPADIGHDPPRLRGPLRSIPAPTSPFQSSSSVHLAGVAAIRMETLLAALVVLNLIGLSIAAYVVMRKK